MSSFEQLPSASSDFQKLGSIHYFMKVFLCYVQNCDNYLAMNVLGRFCRELFYRGMLDAPTVRVAASACAAFTMLFVRLTFARGDKCCIKHQRVTLPRATISHLYVMCGFL